MATNQYRLYAIRSRRSNLVKMKQYPFIFSDDWKYRLARHLLFWFCWWLFTSVLYSFSSFGYKVSFTTRLPFAAVESFFFLVPHMFLSYSLMYWVLPHLLLKGKYLASAGAVVGLFIVSAFISSMVGMYALGVMRRALMGDLFVPPPHYNDFVLYLSLLAGLRGAITIGGLAAAIKLMKYWYMKEQRNLQLQKENISSQLQLLKAQVHPHFLFNTLNNIYSFTQGIAPVASKLVIGLSDLLRYMLYECNQPLVPLKNELKMLKDYIMLEKIRYNDKVDINLDLPEETGSLHIAPLLVLPLVENCFKHGTSQMLEHPWVSLTIFLEGRQLNMKLVNGKAREGDKTVERGIGIANVRKRLELLYPEKHQLKINSEDDVFVVSLKLELEKMNLPKEIRPAIQEQHERV